MTETEKGFLSPKISEAAEEAHLCTNKKKRGGKFLDVSNNGQRGLDIGIVTRNTGNVERAQQVSAKEERVSVVLKGKSANLCWRC